MFASVCTQHDHVPKFNFLPSSTTIAPSPLAPSTACAVNIRLLFGLGSPNQNKFPLSLYLNRATWFNYFSSNIFAPSHSSSINHLVFYHLDWVAQGK
jgi:hypothetical protein